MAISAWLTAVQIASFGIPGMPKSGRGIRYLAEREGWERRKRRQQGGGWEYPLDALPVEIREAYEVSTFLEAQASACASTPILGRASAVPQTQHIPALPSPSVPTSQARQRIPLLAEIRRREARLLILATYDEFRVKTGFKKTRAITIFCEIYSARAGTELFQPLNIRATGHSATLDVPIWVREVRSSVSPNTLRAWDDERRRGNTLALAGRYGHRAGTGRIDRCEKLREFLIGGLLHNPDMSTAQLRKAAEDFVGKVIQVVGKDGMTKEVDLPNLRAIERWRAAWLAANPEMVKLETDPDGWRNGYRLALGTANADVTRPNELWEIDASPSDMLLNDGRYRVYVIVDVYTRRMIILVTRTCSTEAALLALRKAIREWGVCKRLRFDNGSDFKSREFSLALAFLRIEPDPCDFGAPEQKPMVERAIKTFNHDLVVMQPGYIGHSVADRKKIEAKRSFAERLGQSERDAFCVQLDRDELQHRADVWSTGDYGVKAHRGLDGRSPAEVARPFLKERVDVPDEILRLLLSPVPQNGSRPPGLRTVNRDVGILVDGASYWHNDLRPYIRQDVFVRRDPDDMGRICCFTADHEHFICEAINWDRLGVSRQAMVAKAREAEQAYVKTLRTMAKRCKRAFKPQLVAEALAVRAEARTAFLEEALSGTEKLEAPALRAVAAALASRDPPLPLVQPVDQAAHAAIQAEFEATRRIATERGASDMARFRHWLELDRRAHSDELTEEERTWWASYKSTAEYRGLKMVHEEFGDVALRHT